MIALVGCTEKYDYNVVVGVGLLYLASKHAYLYNLPSFYVLVILTVAVDIIQIVTVTNQAAFMRFVITILEIVAKLAILLLMRGSQAKATNPQQGPSQERKSQ